MENQDIKNEGQVNQSEKGTAAEGGKLFTQDDVNRIIGERLSRVKNDSSQELQEREQKATARELQLDAREMLMDAGLPKELLSAINCSTKEAMENSIKVIQGLMGNKSGSNLPGAQQRYRAVTSASGNTNGSGKRSGANDPDAIRQAMGLKR